MHLLANFGPVTQSLLASLFTWAVTALGAAVVFVSPSSNRKFLDASLGFSSGVMLAASFWSLLTPAIEISAQQMAKLAFVPVAVGFAFGALFVYLSDRLTQKYNGFSPLAIDSDQIKNVRKSAPSNFGTENQQKNEIFNNGDDYDDGFVSALRHRSKQSSTKLDHLEEPMADEEAEAIRQRQSWHRILLLIIAITAHNFPEGLAVGVGFGGAQKSSSVSLEKASNLALSIGLQNFPEGMAVALPLAAFGQPKWKAFFYGQISGMIEPIAALIGASLVLTVEFLLPYALSFAAGAMIFVVLDSIVPEANSHGNGTLCSLSSMVGFLVMMALEVGC